MGRSNLWLWLLVSLALSCPPIQSFSDHCHAFVGRLAFCRRPWMIHSSSDDYIEASDLEGIQTLFKKYCDDDGLMSQNQLQKVPLFAEMLAEEELTIGELQDIWNSSPKFPDVESRWERVDVDSFVGIYRKVDDLFEDDDDEEVDDSTSDGPAERRVVDDDDLPPEVLFAAIANEDNKVKKKDLQYWGELQDMLAEGDILASEVDDFFAQSAGDDNALDQPSFVEFCEKISNLFEEDDDVGEEEAPPPPKADQSERIKSDLFRYLSTLSYEDTLPCGLDSTEREQREVLAIASALIAQPSNLVRSRKGQISPTDVAGTWELVYSSSSAMKFNKGLSGLGGSFPNGKFGGVKQKLISTKFLSDMEYKEQIDVTPSTASFEVTVTGDWDLRTSVSLFTGEPSIILNVEPRLVEYGPTSTKADHWKSLGPLNMLDLAYLDDDLRIMRGATSSDTIFIFKKC